MVIDWHQIELEDYIDESVYQLGIRSVPPESSLSYYSYVEAENVLINHPLKERVDRLISTIGLVMWNYRPFLTYTFNEDLFYRTGVKDARVIFASPDILSNWASLFSIEGTSHIKESENIVVSRFLEYLEIATGLNLTIGDKVTVDLLHGLDGEYPFYSHETKTRLSDLTIVGIYTPVFVTGVFGAASRADAPSGLSNIGFQVGLGGFTLVNLDYLSELTGISEIDLVFASVLNQTNMTELVDIIETSYDATVFTAIDFLPEEISEEAALFLRGYEGMTSVILILLVGMGAFAIIALLGSSVEDRSKEYALLKAVGATDRQILVMVSGEFTSTIIASMLISTFLGVALGTVMSMLTFAISPMNPMLFHLPLVFIPTLGIIILFEFILLLLSCVIPSKRAIRT